MSPRGASDGALSASLARDARLRATRVPDDVLAAVRDEHSLRRLRRRIRWWQRVHRVR